MSMEPEQISKAAGTVAGTIAPFVVGAVSAVFSDYASSWQRVAATLGAGFAGVYLGPEAAERFVGSTNERTGVAASILIAFVVMPLVRKILESIRDWKASDTLGAVSRAILKRFGVIIDQPPPPAPPMPPAEAPKEATK